MRAYLTDNVLILSIVLHSFPLNTLINNQTKWQDLLLVYGRTYLMRHISLVRTSRTWMTLCLYTENFRGHFFNNRNILVMKSEKTHNL